MSLDGLCPEGGEPQLWVVRELQTGLTLRSGWLSQQDETSFVHFLQPITALGLNVVAVISDKQRGLEPAVPRVFPHAKHAFCQMHYLKNASEPVAAEDERMKVALRKAVRSEVGELIRQEKVETPGVLTVTGLVPTPVEEPEEHPEEASAQEVGAQTPQASVGNTLCLAAISCPIGCRGFSRNPVHKRLRLKPQHPTSWSISENVTY